MSQQLLRQLPQIEKLLQLPAARSAGKEAPRSAVVAALRGVVDTLRAEILTGKLDDLWFWPKHPAADRSISARK